MSITTNHDHAPIADGSTLETVACAVCGSSAAAPARIRNPKDEFAAAYGIEGRRSKWVVCSDCGLVFQSPRPNAEAVEALYLGGEYHEDRGGLPEHYIQYSLRRSVPALDWAMSAMNLDSGAALDIGAGIGGALVHLERHGWTTAGIEPDDEMATLGRTRFDLDIQTGFFSESTYPATTKFDFAYSCHVWEHLTDPVAVTKAARGVLNPGGYLCIVVPTFRQAKTLAWQCFSTPHNYMFTDVSLGNVLAMSGFEVEAFDYVADADSELWILARAVDQPQEQASQVHDIDAARVVEPVDRIQRELALVPLRAPLGIAGRAKKHSVLLADDPTDFVKRAFRRTGNFAARANQAMRG